MASNGRDSAGNIVSQLSQLADRHLYLVRSISTGLAIAGAFLFAKSIKLTTKFTNAKDIPEKFIKKNVKLQGKLRWITEQGLEVEHIPITLPIVSFFQKRWHSYGSLVIRLAGVELTGCGKIWLRNRLHPSQMLWFQLLSREDSVLDCFILIHRRGLFNECLNVEILRQGLGKVSRVPRIDEHPTLWKFYKRLLQAEVKAQKKGKGMWRRESQLNMLTNKMLNNNIVQKLKQLASNIVNYWKKYRT